MVETRALGVVAVAVLVVPLAGGERVRAAAPPMAAIAAVPAPPARAWKPLRSAAATATSFLQNDWNRYEENYHPSYVLDENPATAWVEGAEGFGESEALTLPLSVLRSARALRLRIWNGYQKSARLWTKNAMPRRVRIAVLDPAGDEVVAPERELARAQGPQEVVIELPPGRRLAAVRLTILSVYPGLNYKDTCISDILVDVDSDVAHNPAAENAKHAALTKWVEGRRATAAYFASKPREFPFAFSKYVEKETKLDRAEFKRRFAARDVIAKSLGPTLFKAAVKDPLRVVPDGLSAFQRYTEDFIQFLKVDQVALFETTQAIASHRTLEDGMEQVWTSAARVGRDPETNKNVRALALDVKDVTTERTTTTYDRDLLLVYGAEGRLETLYRKVGSTGDEDDTDTSTDEIWSFSYNDAGKVQSIELTSLERNRRVYPDNHLGREREDRRAKRVVFTGIADKSS